MATVLSTLYPPLLDTFMPAFVNTGEALVNFTVSPYNSSYDIQYLHVTLVNQKTNKNAFNTITNDTIPSGTVLINGVWIIPFIESSYLNIDRSSNFYTLHIPPTLLKNDNNSNNATWLVQNYYKVQLRFDKYVGPSDFSITDATSTYLSSKRAYFSEWSSVCLLKAIPEITLHFNNFTLEWDNYFAQGGTSTSISAFNPVRVPQYLPGIIPFAGNLTFAGDMTDSGIDPQTKTEYYRRDITTSSNNEFLYSYHITVVDEDENVLADSGTQFPSRSEKTNNFYWLCDLTNSQTNQIYQVILDFVTSNQYTFTKKFDFMLIEPSSLSFNPVFNFNETTLSANGKEEKVIVTSEDGWVTLTISNSGILSSGYLFIKRASSLDNYQKWELIDCHYFEDGDGINHTIIDKTIGSLVSYKYACQYLTTRGNWSKTFISNKVIYPDFYDILLSRGDKQLAIRYNEQITSFTPVVNRVKIDTLGSKYPKFAENAKIRYKQFQLTGLLVAEADYNRKFLNDLDYTDDMAAYDNNIGGKYIIRNDTIKESYWDENYQNIDNQNVSNGTYTTDISLSDTKIRQQKRDTQKNTSHDLYPTENWWWERKFREEAIKWLNDGEPKLYRSMTEGNIIVMIDGVSLTPNSQLGRRVWNFSATLYEIGDGYSLDELDELGIYKIVNAYDSNTTANALSDNSNYISNDIIRTSIGQSFKVGASTTDNNGTNLVILDSNNTNNNNKYKYKYNPNMLLINDENEKVIGKTNTIGENIDLLYTGFYENYDFDKQSIKLHNLKIQFNSLPQWYNLDSFSPSENNNTGLIWVTITGLKDGVEVILRAGLKKVGNQWVIKACEDINGKTVTLEDNNNINVINIEQATENLWTKNEYDTVTDWISAWEVGHGEGGIGGNALIKVELEDTGQSETWINTPNTQNESTNAVYEMIDNNFSEQKKRNYGLGYKLKLTLTSPFGNNSKAMERMIFVNEKGYYQVPSNLTVKEITIYDEAVVTLDYDIEYTIVYNDKKEPNSYELAENIVGQVSGEWTFGTAIAPLISAKYSSIDYDNLTTIKQSVDSWKGICFDGTPYTILNIKPTDDLTFTQYIVGRSGVLNLRSDYSIDSLIVNGKRMIQVPINRQKYLSEWEYVLDNSVTEINSNNEYWWILYDSKNSIKDNLLVKIRVEEIENFNDAAMREVLNTWYTVGKEEFCKRYNTLKPEYNTIYKVINNMGFLENKIYYLNQGWFDVNFPNVNDNDYSIIQAKVPVYGMIDYDASILKKMWINSV